MILDNKIIKYFFYLLPICLVSGPLLPDLIVSIIFLFFIFENLKNNNFTIYKNKFIFFFIFFCLLLIYSIFFISPAPIIEQGTSIFYIRFGIFSFALYYFFHNEENLFNFSKLIFIVFNILILDSLIQFYFGTNILGFKLIPSRVSSFFGDELIMGSYISKIFPINLIFISFLKIENKKKIYLNIFTILFSFLLIFLSGERTSMGMFMFQLLFIFLFLRYNNYSKIISILLFSTIIITLTLFDFGIKNFVLEKSRNVLFFEKIYSSLGRFSHGIKNYVLIKDNKIEIISSHKGHYMTAIKIFDDKTLIGGGIKSFRYNCNKEKYKFNESSCSTHPHNTMLLFMSELGLIGLIIYISFFIFIIFEVLKNYLSSKSKEAINSSYNRYIIISAGLTSTVLPFFPNGNFFNNYMSIIFFLLIGYYLFLRKKI